MSIARPGRRQLVRAAAWTLPVVAGAAAAPAFATSPPPAGVTIYGARTTHDSGTSTYHVLFDLMTLNADAAGDLVSYSVKTLWQDAGGGSHQVTLTGFTGVDYSGPSSGTDTQFSWTPLSGSTGPLDAAFDIPDAVVNAQNATICILFALAVVLDPVSHAPTTYEQSYPMQLPA